MFIVHADQVVRVEPGTRPNYNEANPLQRLLSLIEGVQLAAEQEHYLPEHLQYLFPFTVLTLYGPSAPQQDVLAPEQQDVKTDFQKQNIKDFIMSDAYLVRGWAAAGEWVGPFLRLSYRGGPDSKLAETAGSLLGERIQLFVKVGAVAAPQLITVPYNTRSNRYEVELWGYPEGNLRGLLNDRGRQALDAGAIQVRPDLVQGGQNDFRRENLNDVDMRGVALGHAMHPILPLHVEVAWADQTGQFWDSQGGANYQYEFNMKVRGWENYLGVGLSENPHGGVGSLEYRNLFSNYGRYAGSNELGRQLEAWSFDAFGTKEHGNRQENFMVVDYMDLHILKPQCGIGIHRHRDNQEVFFMMEGRGFMVLGDWCKLPERERCFEVRTLRPGHMALLKGGQLHGLMNLADEPAFLFMFGGYD